MLFISDRQIKKYGVEFFLLFNYHYPMLTKKDLSILKTLLKNTEAEIITKVGTMIQKNTDDLVELITVGFNAQDAGFRKFDKIVVNHEKRIGILEEKSFKTN